MRYEKAETLLQLAMEMQAARGGLGLAEIGERFGVGRRTAMRLRDAVLRSFPQAEELAGDDRRKRWRIPKGTLDRLLEFSAEELAALETATRQAEAANRDDLAAPLAGLAQKLKAVMRPEAWRRAEPDYELLLEAQGLATRPGPRRRIAPGILGTLTQAILACEIVEVRYRRRGNGKRRVRDYRLEPYGFLHGGRHYLAAREADHPGEEIRLFSLPDIERVEGTGGGFVRDPGFDLDAYAARSFGVFQEDPFDVVWRFVPGAAETAAEFTFHPNQVLEPQADGSLIVRFRAGGKLEMAWHLLQWGDAVEVLEPQDLARMVRPFRVRWDALP